MRKIIIFSSLICFILMGIDAFFNLLNATKRTQFPAPVILGVYLLFFIDVILVCVYVLRQELSIRRQLKKHNVEEITYWSLIKAKSASVRPYRREIRLRYAMLLSIALIALFSQIIGLVADKAPTDYFVHINDIIYQISLPIFPAILFLYAFSAES
jgi:hypothetical protein